MLIVCYSRRVYIFPKAEIIKYHDLYYFAIYPRQLESSIIFKILVEIYPRGAPSYLYTRTQLRIGLSHYIICV